MVTISKTNVNRLEAWRNSQNTIIRYLSNIPLYSGVVQT